MFELQIKLDFNAAHHLREYKGKCENLHGHNWKVDIFVRCEKLNNEGMVMDFKDIRSIADEILSKFDHKYLNEVPPFDKINPTSENIAKHIYDELNKKYKERNVTLTKVTVWETDGASASYF